VYRNEERADSSPTPCLAPPAAPRRSVHHYVKRSNLTMKPRFVDCRHVGKLGQAVRSRHGECADFTTLRQGDHDRRVGKSEHGLPNGDAQHHLACRAVSPRGDRAETDRRGSTMDQETYRPDIRDERGFDDNPAVMIERRHDALGLILRYSGLNCSFLKRSTFCVS